MIILETQISGHNNDIIMKATAEMFKDTEPGSSQNTTGDVHTAIIYSGRIESAPD
ncbi:MAG: hypothetical protein QMC95_07560 [Desulfitobacteriaceae bacterium]|nr:hypothetical protein [Desulfitobacteriaceae bacterium]MDI6914063.1 hypothetical protein [Desulfitobacteriaceae bacterium]